MVTTMDYTGFLELASIAFTLLFAFPNLIMNLEDRTKTNWLLNFYGFIATKMLIPAMAYLSSIFLILLCIYTGFETYGEASIMLLLITTFGFLVFVVVGLTYSAIKVIVERVVERQVKEQKKDKEKKKRTLGQTASSAHSVERS